MPQAGFEPAPARFLRPPPLPLGYCGRVLQNALSRTRTCTNVILDHAPLPFGLPEQPALFAVQWSRRDSNPRFLVAGQASYQLDHGPTFLRFFLHMLREGFEPSSSAFGGPRSSDRAIATTINRAVATMISGPGRIRTCNTPLLRRRPLPSWATEPFVVLMHRAGVEPATLRLKAGGSVRLSYRCVRTHACARTETAPGGIRTLNRLFRRELLCVPLSYRCFILLCTVFSCTVP